MNVEPPLFLTMVRSEKDKRYAKLLIESIRRFGGLLGQCPICCFETKPGINAQEALSDLHVQVLPITVPDTVKNYLFADKVYVCAHVEKMIPSETESLIWIDPGCLIIQPPVLYELDLIADAAVRPVHIQNIGILSTDPLNGYWEKVYQTAGMEDVSTMVDTFVDEKHIRAYFNSHAFAVNPSLGVLQKWFDCFETLVQDKEFQDTYCSDQLHRIFLHQATFSSIMATQIEPRRLRILPPKYNYPYNLHQDVPQKKRAKALNELVSITLENRSIDPDNISDIKIHDPLKTWLNNTLKQLI